MAVVCSTGMRVNLSGFCIAYSKKEEDNDVTIKSKILVKTAVLCSDIDSITLLKVVKLYNKRYGFR